MNRRGRSEERKAKQIKMMTRILHHHRHLWKMNHILSIKVKELFVSLIFTIMFACNIETPSFQNWISLANIENIHLKYVINIYWTLNKTKENMDWCWHLMHFDFNEIKNDFIKFFTGSIYFNDYMNCWCTVCI